LKQLTRQTEVSDLSLKLTNTLTRTLTLTLALTLTLVDADTYDLEVINLRDKSVKLLAGRKFGGEAGAPIQSLAFFNRNAERHDFFFNNFQLSRNIE
jgi:hypothetical protein